MADTKINVDLDPKNVINSLNDIADETKKLSGTIAESLGKDAVKSLDNLEKKAENGTGKIKGFFRNLSQTVKEDLKTAFDFGKVMSGIKFGNFAAEGIKQVFDMEKAFGRLNSRLMLTGKELQSFKRNLGSSVAATGQNLEDILPGVEAASSKGGVKNPKQLAAIGESLAKARAATGEDTEGLSSSIVEILKHQNKEVNAKTFNETLAALQGTRVAGAFHTAGEAGKAIEGMTAGLSPAMLKKMGLGTRELGGLAAVSSKGGEQGQSVMQSILKQASEPGGMQKLNAIFGQNIFKNGKMDVGALGKIDKGRFGAYTEQVMGGAANVDQAGLQRLIESFKTGMPEFKKVVDGTNETAQQFKAATDNLGSDIDMFKEGLIDSVRDLGGAFSKAGHDLIHGDFKNLKDDAANIGEGFMKHGGQLAAGVGLTAAIGIATGSGIKGLLGNLGGGAGIVGDLAMAKGLEKAAGVTPVFVVNASEISGGGLAGAASTGILSKLGGAAGVVGSTIGVAGAGLAGYAAGSWLNDNTALGSIGEKIYDALHPDEQKTSPNPSTNGGVFDPKSLTDSVVEGMIKGKQATDKDKKIIYTNASKMPSTGKSQ